MNGADKTLWDQLQASCANGPISYRDYINLVLYADNCGYYTRDRDRVGRSPERDFYTAESLGKVFAQLVITAAHDLLGKTTAAQSTFIEIAAEPGAELVSRIESHPFADSRVIRQGDAICADGPVVIFANEWLDALPFHRLIFRDGQWYERGVRLNAEHALEDVLLDHFTPEVAAIQNRLPVQALEGYELDLPLQAEAAIADLLAQDWTGILLLFDYGKTWSALSSDCPAGTARTYYQHTQANDLLDQPGKKDITCDVCWDPLADLLSKKGLQSVTLETQESFLVQRAQRAAESIVSDTAGMFSPDRQTLMELIHPAHMGRRFQVLWALRGR
ncbi:MAG: SAM-dependent MidA family methyltransferase [Bacteroidia bacterium]|jgi:SAM-dependent MidA family methyltransferase